MPVDFLKNRLDPQDRRMLREWLTFTCEIYPLAKENDGAPKYDEDSEEVEGVKRIAVPCHIDASVRRLASAKQEIVPFDMTVLFRREQDVDVNYRLANGKARDGSVIFKEARVVAIDAVVHTQKVSILKQAMCVRN